MGEDRQVERRAEPPRGEEDRLRAIIDHVADGIVIVGADGRVRFVNPASEALFGRPASELLGGPFGFPLADETAEIDVVRKGGTSAVAELRVVEMEWEGEPALLVSLRDITDRKHAEERLHQLVVEQAARGRAEDEERRSRFLAEVGTLLDSSFEYPRILAKLARLAVAPKGEVPDSGSDGKGPPQLADWCVIDMLEPDGGIRRVALAHHDPQKEALLEEMKERFPPQLDGVLPAADALRRDEPVLLERVSGADLDAAIADPEHRALLREVGISSLIATPLVSRGETLGAVTFVCAEKSYDETDLALARDLAQRAALSVANSRLYHDAQDANRAKSDFLAVMSHELRTPLNAIMGYSDLMVAEVTGPINEKQKEQLSRIHAASEHLLQIVEEILTYTKLEAGREKIEPVPTDLRELVREVGLIAQPLVQKDGRDLVIQESPGPALVETDAPKVRRILLNLLSNAAKFTDRGEVRVKVSPDGEGHFLQVEDTGIGIAEADLERVFEPFWQVEQSTRRVAQGTGLGLSVAQRLAGVLGGSLTVESRPGRGSTFTLWLPKKAPTRPRGAP